MLSIVIFIKKKKEQKKPPNPFHLDQLHYNIEQDCYYCLMGEQMSNIGIYKKKTKNSHLQTYTRYQASNCSGCPLNGCCFKAKENRIIEHNYQLIRLKAKEKLLSPSGVVHQKQRCWGIGVIFGNSKHNMNFKHFILRDIYKVETEIGLIIITMAHNLKK